VSPDRIEADYVIETAVDPYAAAEGHGGGAIQWHFRTRAGRDAGAQGRAAAARVERLEVIGSCDEASLPGARTASGLEDLTRPL